MSKYRAQPTVIEGIRFASRKEAYRYLALKDDERNGRISGLELQPRYDLFVKGVNCGFYKADFRYIDRTTGRVVVEDVKGFLTPVYRIKKKLMRALHGIDIKET